MRFSVNTVKKKYDVIVIGSGLAGLTAANRLTNQGYSVAVLEQHYNFGGLATWFKRPQGHIFDVSLHGFPYGMIKSIRKYWGEELAKSIDRISEIRFDNPQFSFSTPFDKEDFVHKLVHYFKVPQQQVDLFFQEARSMSHLDSIQITTRELFQKYFPNRLDVWRLLMEPITYANGSTLDEPALTYGIVFSNFMNKGVYTFRGGTNKLIQNMKMILKQHQVDLLNHAQVEKIVIEKKKVKGVMVNGHFLEAQAVLSNAGLRVTTDQLIGCEHFSRSFVEQIKNVKLSTSSCQVYMGIKEGETVDDIGELFFTSTYPTYDSDALCSFYPSSRTFSFYGPRTRPGSSRYSIVSSTNAKFEDWASLNSQKYKEEKARLATETIEVLEKYLPNIQKKINHVEVSTPKTFVRYTQHTQGAVFGTKFEGLKVSEQLSEHIPGVFHTGSVGIIMGGWLGAVNYGVMTAHKVDGYLSSFYKGQVPSMKPMNLCEQGERHVI